MIRRFALFALFAASITLLCGFTPWLSGALVLTAPTNSVLPVISSSSPVVGTPETTTNGTWTGSPTFAYQWQSAGSNVGTNSSSYTPVIGDIGNTLTVVVTATNGSGSTPATSSATSVVTSSGGGGAVAFSLPTGDTMKFMATSANGGSDSNDGLAATVGGGHGPWLTPNHAMNCGDVIVAGAGSYSGSGIGSYGTVSNCPSTTGGIDGTGGVYFATLLCGGSDLESCPTNFTSASTSWAFDVKKNNWAVEGFKVTGFVTGQKGAFAADGATAIVHHNAFINDIAANVGVGFSGLDNGTSHDVPGATGFDYLAYVGNIAQNAEQLNGNCLGAMDMPGPASVDNNAGTHFLQYGNFAWSQSPNSICQTGGGIASDVENFFMDTPDAHGMTNDVVFMNNIGWSAYRYGLAFFSQNFNSINGLHLYEKNNTLFNNNTVAGSGNGDINIQMNNSGTPIVLAANNISQANQGTECGALVGGSTGPITLASITFGGTGNENILWSLSSGSKATCAFNGFSFGANFAENPTFANTTDLLANQTGAPTCTGFENTTQCMGWNASTSTLTTPSVISDLVPSSTHSAGKGYQQPSVTCAANALYPTWLKGIVYLHWTGSGITQNPGLVTRPCGL